MIKSTLLFSLVHISLIINAQNVGIATTTPHSSALLHLNITPNTAKGLLISGQYDDASIMPNLGAGSRLMFYPERGAFRAGVVEGDQWDNIFAGKYSSALGYNNTAYGIASFAAGNANSATGHSSIAIGFTSLASSDYSVAIGAGNKANGYYSLATGMGSTASGENSTVMGYFSTASGNTSTATGSSTIASGDFSSSHGFNTRAMGYASTVIGMNNDPLLGIAETSVSANTPLLIIGNGSDPWNRSNATVVRKNGKVGIGNITPEYNLDIANRVRIRSGGDITTSAGLWLNKNDNSALAGFMGIDDFNNVGFYGATSGWSFVVNTVNGNATLKGTLTQNSDARLKRNILLITSAINKLLLIKGYTYYWRESAGDHSLQTGVLA